MMNFNYLFFLLFLSLKLSGQSLTVPLSGDKKENIEEIILQERDFGKNTAGLYQYLRPLALSQSKTDIVLYDALIANGISKANDSLNALSNLHYMQSIKNAEKTQNPALIVWTHLNYINYLYKYRDYTVLPSTLLKTVRLADQLPSEQIILPSETFKKIGWLMQTFGHYEKSIHYLKKSQEFTPVKSSENATLLDNIGTSYLYSGDLKNAEIYFNRSIALSAEVQDFVRMAKAKGNLAQVFEKHGNFAVAEKLLLEDIAGSEKYQATQNLMFASTLIAKLYLKNKQLLKAEKYIKIAEKIAVSKPYYRSSELEIMKLKLEVAIQLGNNEDELTARRSISNLENSLKNSDGPTNVKKANWTILEDDYARQIEVSAQKAKEESWFKTIAIAFACFILILAVYQYRKHHRFKKKNQQKYEETVKFFEEEKNIMDRQLLNAKNSIESQIDFLRNKNLQIKNLNQEIEQLRHSKSFYLEEKQGGLQKILENHLMTEENWLNFKNEFRREYGNFYDRLNSEFPELTDSNLRIILLSKLDFNNVEISGLLGITPDAIKKSKQRLRKKLGEKYDRLNDLINISKN